MRSAVALGLMCAALVLGRPAFGDDASSKSKFQQLTEGKQKKDGMWTLYQKDQQLLVELSANDLKRSTSFWRRLPWHRQRDGARRDELELR